MRPIIKNQSKGIVGHDGNGMVGGRWANATRLAYKDIPVEELTECISDEEKAENWRDGSALYLWVTNQLLKGKSRKAIVAEAIELYEKNPALYGTRNGKPLCEGTLSRWAREISAD